MLVYNGKKIGRIEGSKLIKRGSQAVLFRVMDGFGMPKNLVESELMAQNVGSTSATARVVRRPIQTVEIRYQDKLYFAPLRSFKENGIPYHRPPFEEQYILPRKFFLTEDTNQTSLI